MGHPDVIAAVDGTLYDHHARNTEVVGSTWCGLSIYGVSASDGFPVRAGVDRSACCPRCVGRRQQHVNAIVTNIYGPAA